MINETIKEIKRILSTDSSRLHQVGAIFAFFLGYLVTEFVLMVFGINSITTFILCFIIGWVFFLKYIQYKYPAEKNDLLTIPPKKVKQI